jgi:transcription-repair coupling factor (superfamily II helicase)
MEQDFLKKLFEGKNIGLDINLATVINNPDLDIAKLLAYSVAENQKNNVIFLPSQFLNPELAVFGLENQQKLALTGFVSKLGEFGYEKVDRVYAEMQFSVKGDVLILYTNIDDLVYKIEFFDDIVEKITLVDPLSLRFIKEVKNIVILNVNPEEKAFHPEIIGTFDKVSLKPIIYTENRVELNSFESASEDLKLNISSIPAFHKNVGVFKSFITPYSDYDFYYSGHFSSLIPAGFKNLEGGKKLIELNLPISLQRGFIHKDKKLVLLTDYEILSTLNLEKAKQGKYSKFNKLFETEINVGDYVVHEAHGIGIYKGIESKLVLGKVSDYAIIKYEGEDQLLIPFTQLGRLSKYISEGGTTPRITKLGTAEWETIRRKLKKNVEEVAKELIEIYAKKSMEKGIEFERDSNQQEKFEAICDFTLTEDQIRSMNEVKSDMESDKPMDRLVIGDVGFGKTEIALRATFKAVHSGKQVLVLAPTTVLVSQLSNVFSTRFKEFGVNVARVSRFDGTANNKLNIEKAKKGEVDVLIGTHRLLSNDVVLPNLGLLVVDEEQRFGVKQKEKIRKLRANIDLISMSATPIPRTLQMALTGIKDISIIATPPIGRLAVHNEVIFKDEMVEKIKDELDRDGQVFIVHNKIEDIETFAKELQDQLPKKARIAIGHGQMRPEKLEKIMFEFLNRKYDILIATTIIENGLDIPAVNTIIIDQAHNFGLAQLYQLRGRVGRAKVQGYCYLTLPKTREFINLHKNPDLQTRNLNKLLEANKIEDKWITPDAVSRIEAILENQELGAGFKIASRDLEIRGSGNILGTEQSGQINAVGYELYIRLLEQEIDRIRALV